MGLFPLCFTDPARRPLGRRIVQLIIFGVNVDNRLTPHSISFVIPIKRVGSAHPCLGLSFSNQALPFSSTERNERHRDGCRQPV